MNRVTKALILISIAFLLMFFTTQNTVDVITEDFDAPSQNIGDYERFFSDDIVHHLKIIISGNEWKGLTKDMLKYRRTDDRMRTGNYREAILIYTDKDVSYELGSVAIRTKGNTTRVLPEDLNGLFHRASFKVKVDYAFNTDVVGRDIMNVTNRTFMGMNEFDLKSNMDRDRSMIHEKFAYDLFRKVGVAAPRNTLTTVTFVIDGEEIDYGVYSVIEPINKKFITKRYGKKANDGNLYKCLWQDYGPATLSPISDTRAVGVKDWTKNYRPAYDLVTNNANINHEVLYEFIDKLNYQNKEDTIKYLEENFEIEKYLKATAINVLMGMPDDYWAMGNNYFLYFNNKGKIEFIPYDYDNSLGYGWDGEAFGGYEGLAKADIYQWKDLASIFMNRDYKRPLIEKLLATPKYREMYESFLWEFIQEDNELYSYDEFTKLFDKMYKMYEPYLENDTGENNFMFLTSEEQFIQWKIESVTEQLNH